MFEDRQCTFVYTCKIYIIQSIDLINFLLGLLVTNFLIQDQEKEGGDDLVKSFMCVKKTKKENKSK